MMMTPTHDLIIIGAGPGGYETAAGAARLGLRVLIIERRHPGGTCLNCGCIPTKALCRSAETAAELRAAGLPAPSFLDAVKRKDEIVAQLREGVMTELRDVDYLHGEARFISPRVIEVDSNRYTAPKIIVATGSSPVSLPIPGSELALDSDALLSLTTLPASIAIIGGGVVGVEFASILASFGVKVSLLEYCREILPSFDADIAKRLRMTLKRRGINIITQAQVTAIHPGFTIDYLAKGRQSVLESDMVLMAVGRHPVIPDSLLQLGVKTDRGAILVDDDMQTSIPGIYAIGDVNGRCMLAHAATAQGRVALGLDQPLDPIPSAVFTVPECAMVGLTEEQCRQAHLDYIVGTATFRANGKAMTMGQPDGLVKTIVERTSLQLLGCHICGPHAADLIAEPTLAISAELPATAITRTIHAHPTLAEALTSALSPLTVC